MILIDTNIPLYSVDTASSLHEKARIWFDEKLSGSTPIALSWPVIHGFLRISTHPRILADPLSIKEAAAHVDNWLKQPCVCVLQSSSAYWEIYQTLILKTHCAGNLVPDAALAALAIEHGCTLYSTDTDFARFQELKWVNPLAL